jgi:hypothetical protein
MAAPAVSSPPNAEITINRWIKTGQKQCWKDALAKPVCDDEVVKV